MRECCGLGLQINVFQTSSHFYSIFSVCRENYILSYESIYLFTRPSLLFLGRQPQLPSLNSVRSRAGSPGPTQRAAPSEGVLCRKQPGRRHNVVDLPSSPRKENKTFLINSHRGSAKPRNDRITEEGRVERWTKRVWNKKHVRDASERWAKPLCQVVLTKQKDLGRKGLLQSQALTFQGVAPFEKKGFLKLSITMKY